MDGIMYSRAFWMNMSPEMNAQVLAGMQDHPYFTIIILAGLLLMAKIFWSQGKKTNSDQIKSR